jgi:hypothetical protein
MSAAEGEMTLAFDLSALQALADPGAAVADARQWTRYVGVIGTEPTHVLRSYTRKRRIREDFFSGPEDRTETLQSVREQFDGDRYVLVGTDEADRSVAAAAEWEYLPVSEAAEAADWTLGEDHEPTPTAQREDWP